MVKYIFFFVPEKIWKKLDGTEEVEEVPGKTDASNQNFY
jgi:uncharacterized membrane protein